MHFRRGRVVPADAGYRLYQPTFYSLRTSAAHKTSVELSIVPQPMRMRLPFLHPGIYDDSASLFRDVIPVFTPNSHSPREALLKGGIGEILTEYIA